MHGFALDISKRSGDYHRYIAEFASDDSKLNYHARKTSEFYEAASKILNIDLPPTHPDRMALALDHSLLYHDIFDNVQQSFIITKRAYDAAFVHSLTLRNLHPRSASLMESLAYNLGAWADIVYGAAGAAGASSDGASSDGAASCGGACGYDSGESPYF